MAKSDIFIKLVSHAVEYGRPIALKLDDIFIGRFSLYVIGTYIIFSFLPMIPVYFAARLRSDLKKKLDRKTGKQPAAGPEGR
jgi:hypothetical protein